MRVLVTGGTGFVGNAVMRHLREGGFDPIILSSRSDLAAGEFEVIQADLTHADQVRQAVHKVRPEALCHLAALTRARDSFDHPLEYYRVNVGGTLNVLEACKGLEVSKVVYVSTGAVYGRCEGEISESTPTHPTNPYGASKLAAEHALSFEAKASGKTATILRCLNISGAVSLIGDFDTSRIIPKALAVAGGQAEYLGINGDGSVIREFVHVKDVASAVECALTQRPEGQVEVYNVGSGVISSMSALVDTVQRVTGKTLRVRHNPPQNEPQKVVTNSQRIRAELKWNPEILSLETMIYDAWEAHKARYSERRLN